VRKLLLAGVACSAFAVGPALAADLAVRAPIYKAPPPVRVFTWTGVYIGGHGGCGFDTKDYATSFTDADPGAAGSSFSFPTTHGGGCFGGGQIGANYQFSNLVVGLEADASWGSIRGTGHVLETEPGTIEILGLYEQKLTSFGTVRGRLGYASTWGTAPFLAYVTGGWAWARNELTTQATNSIAGALPGAVIDAQNHSGWSLGGGLEVAVAPNWSIKGEYLYMDLGSKTYATSAINDDGALPAASLASVNLKLNTVKVGVNYKFGAY
jgi:outer membrane immunogenic protein